MVLTPGTPSILIASTTLASFEVSFLIRPARLSSTRKSSSTVAKLHRNATSPGRSSIPAPIASRRLFLCSTWLGRIQGGLDLQRRFPRVYPEIWGQVDRQDL